MCDNIITEEKMYYDKYEFQFGDGFFPSNKKYGAYIEEANIEFIIKKNCWKQTNGICISGLDCDIGENLLFYLNNKFNVNCISILNIPGRQIYPKN